MQRWLEGAFLADALLGLVLGSLLLVIPGRLLGAFGWAPIDPLISRILGAGILAFSWGSFTGWRVVKAADNRDLNAEELAQVRVRLEMDALFAILAAAGLLRHLLQSRWPWYVWTLFILIALAALLFGGLRLRLGSRRSA